MSVTGSLQVMHTHSAAMMVRSVSSQPVQQSAEFKFIQTSLTILFLFTGFKARNHEINHMGFDRRKLLEFAELPTADRYGG